MSLPYPRPVGLRHVHLSLAPTARTAKVLASQTGPWFLAWLSSLGSASAWLPSQADPLRAVHRSAGCLFRAHSGWESLLPRVWPDPTPCSRTCSGEGVRSGDGGRREQEEEYSGSCIRLGLNPGSAPWGFGLLYLCFLSWKRRRGSPDVVSGRVEAPPPQGIISELQVQRFGLALVKVRLAASALKSWCLTQ